MNILQVTERFSEGGLEKFIGSLTSELQRRGHECYLAVGDLERTSNLPFRDSDIFDSFRFQNGFNESVGDFVGDVDRLCQLISKFDIDYVVVHPFYSLYPAVAAAKIMKKPVAFILHGALSATFPLTFSENALYRLAVDSSIDCIFSVQRELGKSVTQNAPVTHIKNPIEKKPMRSASSDAIRSKRWALCSRIDDYKIDSIRLFLSWVPELDIDHIDVYGGGPRVEELKRFAQETGLSRMLTWHSFDPEWQDKIRESNAGVIGVGRVAIEALAMNLPVLMLSVDDNPYGLVDRSLFEASKDANFSRPDSPVLNGPERLQAQLDCLLQDPRQFLFGEEAASLFSVEAVADTFLETVRPSEGSIASRIVPAWKDVVDELRMVDDQDSPYFHVLERKNTLWNCFHLDAFQESARSALLLSALASHQAAETDRRLAFAAQIETRTSLMEETNSHLSNQLEGLLHESEELRVMRSFCSELSRSVEDQSDKLEDARRCMEMLHDDIADIKRSNSWKIGRAITAFPRWLKRKIG